jgi:hypothetical protein
MNGGAIAYSGFRLGVPLVIIYIQKIPIVSHGSQQNMENIKLELERN